MKKLLAVLALVLLSPSLAAQSSRLGSIDFPTSGAPVAKPDFIRGMLFLHSFEYDSAAAAFRLAQQKDPRFVMAYWGEAMTYNHPVWNQQDLARARAVLQRLAPTPDARAAMAPTPRERAWLETAEVLYGDGTKERRDTLFSAAMERIAAGAPKDLEAQTLYALSLLGLSQGVRVVPTYMRAGAIALAAMEKNPDHPGAAHYAIHAFDDPIHAPLGLHAAEAYAGIAPGAAHAQHMTTHIFLALGMWDRVVSQNVIASGPDRHSWQPGHYTSWLDYGLVQEGRFRDARVLLELLHTNMGPAPSLRRRASFLEARAQYVVNTECRSDSLTGDSLDVHDMFPLFRSMGAFASGYSALRQGEPERSAAELRVLDSLAAALGNNDSPVPAVLAMELRGVTLVSAGDTSRGLALLRRATAIEDTLPMEFGPPVIVKPSHELLGETLLDLKRPVEAESEFARALELAPRRLRSLAGLRAAASAAGDTATAERTREQLRAMLRAADRDLPIMAQLTGH